MSFEPTIYARLSGYSGLTALVSTRIYPVELPPGVVYPAVSFFRMAAAPIPAMGSDPALVGIPLQVDCWAKNLDESGNPSTAATKGQDSVQAIAAQVLGALQRWRSAGVMQDVLVTNFGLDIPEEFTGIAHRVLEFTCWYEGTY